MPLAYILYPRTLVSFFDIPVHVACAHVYIALASLTSVLSPAAIADVSLFPSVVNTALPRYVLLLPAFKLLAVSAFSLTYTINVYSTPDDNLSITTDVSLIPSIISTFTPSTYVSTP